MTTTDQSGYEEGEESVNRRSVLKTIGASSLVAAGAVGSASATGAKNDELRYNFYGCSQVCVNKKKAKAVIWTGREFRYASISATSNRNDPPVRDWANVYCYEVSGQEAIVGIKYSGEFIPNPNRCAQNYPTP